MRLLRVAVLAALLSVLGTVVPAASAAGPAGTWGTGIMCVNMGTSQASITVKFYRADTGVLELSYPDPTPIPAGASRGYFTPGGTPPGLPSPFIGSAVVESDQPLACNVNTQTTGVGTASDPIRVDTSKGVLAGAATLYAPQVMKTFGGNPGWNSYISVQNTSGATAAVTVTYKDRFGNDVPAAQESANIPANTNHIFYQSDNANLPGNFLGSAKITSSADLAGVVAMYNAATSNVDSQFLTYNTVGTGANKVLVPRIVRNYYGYNGGLTIQNVGGAPTSVDVTFSFAGNTYVYSNPSLAAGAAWALYAPNIPALLPVDSLAMSQRFGSAVVQAGAGGQIVAIVNEDNRVGPAAEQIGQGATYNAMNDGTQSTTVSFAQITKNAGGFYTGGFNVANTTATPGTCNISYSGASAANETNVPLPANGSFKRFTPQVTGLPTTYNASVTVTCTVPVVGISNLAVNPGSGRLGDSFTQVAGTNQ